MVKTCLLNDQSYGFIWAFPGGSDSKESACSAGDPGSNPGLGRSPEEENGSILAWRIPWTEESGSLQSMGLQRVGHDCATNTHTHIDCTYKLLKGIVFKEDVKTPASPCFLRAVDSSLVPLSS